jgi:hypothetical protein
VPPQVTVLAVFKKLGARDDLYMTVFGESVLNDAVGIVLYQTIAHFLDGNDPVNAASVFKGGASLGARPCCRHPLLRMHLQLRSCPSMQVAASMCDHPSTGGCRQRDCEQTSGPAMCAAVVLRECLLGQHGRLIALPSC